MSSNSSDSGAMTATADAPSPTPGDGGGGLSKNLVAQNLEDTLAKKRKRFPGLAPESYRHPLDQQATNSLRSVPGFEYAVSKLSRFSIEHLVYVQFCATAVKVTERQCGGIYKLLQEACAVLDVPEPSLFLSQTPIVNAFALGKERPMMVLHTGLVELLTEEELLGVIAHELGHIHCGHSVYRLMLLLIELAGRVGGAKLGVGDVFSLPIQMALLEWARKAEFSADRAAILVTQNPEAVFSTLFKLTGGSPKVFNQMDRDEYLKQADEYDQPDHGKLDKFYRAMLESGMTHPIPVLRAREALRYGETPEYRALLEGRYARFDKNGRLTPAAPSAPTVCPNCGQEADTGFSFCVHCGADLKRVVPASLPEPGTDVAETPEAPTVTETIADVAEAASETEQAVTEPAAEAASEFAMETSETLESAEPDATQAAAADENSGGTNGTPKEGKPDA